MIKQNTRGGIRVGADIGGTKTALALIDETDQIIGSVVKWATPGQQVELLVAQISQNLTKILAKHELDGSQIQGIGLGVPGVVDRGTGLVRKAPNLGWRDVPLTELIQRELIINNKMTRSIRLDNDANCAARAEMRGGALHQVKNGWLLTIGTGIGGALVVNNQLWADGDGNSEVGHLRVDHHPDATPCNCSQRGCWEVYASASGLIRLTKAALSQDTNSLIWELVDGRLDLIEGKTAFAAARAGDQLAQQVVANYLNEVAIGLCSLINILPVEKIVIGGGIAHEGDGFFTPIRQLVAQMVFGQSFKTAIEPAQLGEEAGVVGAALLIEKG